MVDIDGDVIEACKKYFPTVACAFQDPRADVEVGDGVKFVADHQGEGFDVIIVDSSDPVGPAEGLFSAEFYKSIQKYRKHYGFFKSIRIDTVRPNILYPKHHRLFVKLTDYNCW